MGRRSSNCNCDAWVIIYLRSGATHLQIQSASSSAEAIRYRKHVASTAAVGCGWRQTSRIFAKTEGWICYVVNAPETELNHILLSCSPTSRQITENGSRRNASGVRAISGFLLCPTSNSRIVRDAVGEWDGVLLGWLVGEREKWKIYPAKRRRRILREGLSASGWEVSSCRNHR